MRVLLQTHSSWEGWRQILFSAALSTLAGGIRAIDVERLLSSSQTASSSSSSVTSRRWEAERLG
jgi:hypothetical protein